MRAFLVTAQRCISFRPLSLVSLLPSVTRVHFPRPALLNTCLALARSVLSLPQPIGVLLPSTGGHACRGRHVKYYVRDRGVRNCTLFCREVRNERRAAVGPPLHPAHLYIWTWYFARTGKVAEFVVTEISRGTVELLVQMGSLMCLVER